MKKMYQQAKLENCENNINFKNKSIDINITYFLLINSIIVYYIYWSNIKLKYYIMNYYYYYYFNYYIYYFN